MNAPETGFQQDMHTAQYLLENLGFVIKLEKSCFQPIQQLEFLGFLVNSRDMTLLLPDCKVSSIKTLCSTLLSQRDVLVRELSQFIGKLTASIQAVFPAPLHYRNLQQLKHQALSRDRSFDSRIPLSTEAIDELRWWLAHLDAWNGRALLHPSPGLIIETDASRMGWGGCLSSRPDRGACGLRWSRSSISIVWSFWRDRLRSKALRKIGCVFMCAYAWTILLRWFISTV